MHKLSLPDFMMDLVYSSYLGVADQLHGLDSATRNLSFAQELFDALNINWQNWPRVTITGSKGKGSTAALLASILQASGERVGLVSSPEMRSFNERIRIDGHCVSNKELEDAAKKIAPAVHAITSRLVAPSYLGPSATILALAAMIFKDSDVSVLVVEAGRGGEYDEAKLLQAPVSVLTPIMLEHPDKLGPTIQDIASTKTYITAPGSSIITAPQSNVAQSIIKNIAVNLNAQIQSVHSDIRLENPRNTPGGVTCDMYTEEVAYPNIHISLAGFHQAENAATAILAAQSLAKHGVKCTTDSIYTGVSRVKWPGRAQVLQQHPWILVDGAINRESTQQICQLVREFPAKHITALVSVPKPKDLDGVCAEVSKIAHRIILTELPVPTLTWYSNALQIASKYSDNVQLITPVEDALAAIANQTQPDEGALLLGTQSFVGSTLDFWNVDTCNIW